MLKPLLIPKGGFSVGSIVSEPIDHTRRRSLVHNEMGRRLLIKVWYPSVEPNSGQSCERHWEQLLQDPHLPLPMRYLSKWVARYATSTYTGANSDNGPGSVIIYNHGLIGFASENTSLAEHLASNGHIVIAVQHLDQLQEYRDLESKVSKKDRERNKLFVKQLQSESEEERQETAVKFYENASNTNAITSERAVDSQFVVNNLDSLLENTSGLKLPPEKNRNFSAIGLSLGGAASMELAKIEPRIKSVVNIDGGVFGKLRKLPLTVPCSMIYSESNKGINELAFSPSNNQVKSTTINGSKHISFHDIALIFPRMLRLLGALGDAEAKSVISDRNDLIESFLREKSV